MKKRTDRSMLLTLSEQEANTLRDIIKPQIEEPARMSLLKRVLCELSAVFLFGLIVVGMAKPDLVMGFVQLVGHLLTLLFWKIT